MVSRMAYDMIHDNSQDNNIITYIFRYIIINGGTGRHLMWYVMVADQRASCTVVFCTLPMPGVCY